MRTLFIFAFSFIFCNVYSQTPDIKDVATKYYSTYATPDEYLKQVQFEKKNNDWYIRTEIFENNKIKDGKTFKFYDGKQAKYLTINFPAAKAERVKYEKYLEQYLIDNYKLHPYFGYRGWYKDVIKLYENKKQKTDDELYSLGRAYSAYASALINDAQGHAVLSEIIVPQFVNGKLSADAEKKYNEISKKAQESFLALAKRNPNYETIVGKITVKYANEVMTQYQTLQVYSKSSILPKLPKNLYDDSTITNARKLLGFCKQGSLYITYGDNDFYPLLYVQNALNIRKDVQVVSYSFFSLDQHIYSNARKAKSTKGFALSIDSTVYKQGVNEMISITSDYEKAEPYSAFIHNLTTKKKNENAQLNYLVNIPLKNNEAFEVKIINFSLYKNEWVLLDIIANLGNRKLYFTYPPTGFSNLYKFVTRKDNMCQEFDN